MNVQSKTSSSVIHLICGSTGSGKSTYANKLKKERGCSLQTHFLDVDIEERWRRVQNRNSEKSETFRLEVSRDMFDFFESIWEQPNSSERISLNEVFSGSQH